MIAQVTFLTICLRLVAANVYYDPHQDFHHAQPYSFGYSNNDQLGGEQHRHETGDGQNVKGSYGFKDSRGIYREVNYVADNGGFRAEVKTNEPGTAPHNPADVKMMSSAHPYFGSGHGQGARLYGSHLAGQRVSSLLGNGYKVDWDGQSYGIPDHQSISYGSGHY